MCNLIFLSLVKRSLARIEEQTASAGEITEVAKSVSETAGKVARTKRMVVVDTVGLLCSLHVWWRMQQI